MRLKEFAEALGVSRNVAARLAVRIPGARKEPGEPGQIPRWILPDDAPAHVDEAMVEQAKGEVAVPDRSAGGSPGAGSPELAEERRAVERERLAAERARAEAERLRAEAERRRLEEREAERRRLDEREGRLGADPRLAERLAGLESRLDEALRRPDPVAAVGEMVKTFTPLLAPVLERLTAPPPSPAPTAALADVLALVEKARGFLGPPEGQLRTEVELGRDMLRQGIALGREQAAAAVSDGEGSAWTPEGVARIVEVAAPFLRDGLDTIRTALGRRPGLPLPSALASESPSPPAQVTGGLPMDATPALREIVDALLDELRKPPGQRDIPGVAVFLTTLPMAPDGGTFYDLALALARSPEVLARVRLKLMDPRLAAPEVWPAVLELLAFLRDEGSPREEEANGERA